MKDNNGLYYYPNPLNKKFRMYVRQEGDEVFFRLWNAEEPALWQDHGWVPYGAICKAAEMYAGKTIDPKQAYDINVAKALLKHER
jgi:hypothetical protein